MVCTISIHLISLSLFFGPPNFGFFFPRKLEGSAAIKASNDVAAYFHVSNLGITFIIHTALFTHKVPEMRIFVEYLMLDNTQ